MQLQMKENGEHHAAVLKAGRPGPFLLGIAHLRRRVGTPYPAHLARPPAAPCICLSHYSSLLFSPPSPAALDTPMGV